MLPNQNKSDARVSILLIAMTLSIFASLTLLYNYRFYINFCSYAWDYLIFMEVIKKVAAGAWNPFISSLQASHLNDHWDPIYYIVSHISHIMPLHWAGWVIELSFILLCCLPFFYAVR